MEDVKSRITELADLMSQFGLSHAELGGEDWKVAFTRRPPAPPTSSTASAPQLETETSTEEEYLDEGPAATAKGIPVSSPMNGIYYTSPSPSAPPFVKEGETVSAGQVVGLIEAMKVFNEIVAPLGGKVVKIVAENGALVQPGDVLLVIE